MSRCRSLLISIFAVVLSIRWFTEGVSSYSAREVVLEKTEEGRHPVSLRKETVDELMMFDRRLIAAVRCDKVSFVDQGTRNERVIIETSVLAVGEGDVRSSYLLTRHTQGNPLMTIGKSYLIAAYDNGVWTPAWSLIEWVPIDQESAQNVAKKAGKVLRDRVTEDGGSR